MLHSGSLSSVPFGPVSPSVQCPLRSLVGGFDDGTPDEARRRAMVAALTMIGALTISRVVTDRALSNAILRNAEDSITGS